jgi:hypothetical protein
MSLQERQEAMRRRIEAERSPQQEEHMTDTSPSSVCGHSAGMTTPETQVRSGPRRGATDVQTDAPRARLLDLKSAGAYLGVSYWTMRDLVFGGIIPSVKIPSPRAGDGRAIRRILVDRRDLDAFIEKNKELEQ